MKYKTDILSTPQKPDRNGEPAESKKEPPKVNPRAKKRAAPPPGKNTISIKPDKNNSQYAVRISLTYIFIYIHFRTLFYVVLHHILTICFLTKIITVENCFTVGCVISMVICLEFRIEAV